MQITGLTEALEGQTTINVAKRKTSFVETILGKASGKNEDDSNQPVNGIALNISDEGKKKLEEQDNFLSYLQDQLDSIKEQGEAQEKGWEEFGKCLKIAMSIASGDNVPTQDVEYLKEHNPELFGQAMALRMPKKDPEDCESVLDDEEDSAESEGSSARIVESGTSIETGGESAAAEVTAE